MREPPISPIASEIRSLIFEAGSVSKHANNVVLTICLVSELIFSQTFSKQASEMEERFFLRLVAAKILCSGLSASLRVKKIDNFVN